MFIYPKFYWLLLFCLPLMGVAQNAIITMDLINEEDGMRNSQIRDVHIDSRGLIWMATANGLHRYDGHTFAIYDNREASPVRLTSYNIHAVTEDEEGNIWVGTENGINVFDPASQKITTYFDHGNESHPPTESKIKFCKVLKDDNGSIWVLEHGRLGRFEDGAFLFEYKDELILIDHFILDADNQILLINRTLETSFYLNIDSQKLTKIKEVSRAGVLINPLGNSLYINEKGRICFYLGEGDLFQFFPEENRLAKAEIEKNTIGDVIHQLLEKGNNTNIPTNNNGQNNIVYNLLDLTKSKDGLYWLATNLGLVKVSINPSFFKKEEKLSNASLRGMVEGEEGILYLGGYNPFNFILYNVKTEEINFNSDMDDIWDMAFVNNDSLVVINGGVSMISLFDVNQEKYVYQSSYSDLISYLRGFVILKNGKIIMGSEKGGLFITQVKNLARLVPFQLNPPSPDLEDIIVNCLYQESDSVFWIGSSGKVISINLVNASVTTYDIHSLEEQHKETKEIYDIHKTAAGQLWLATNNGLVYYDPKTKKSKLYTTENGLSDNLVYCILPFDSTALWLSTNNGLNKLNILQQKFYVYTEEDGISYREFNRNSSLKTRDGRFYFGGVNGFTSFYPGDELQQDIAFEPFISSYSIYDRKKNKLTEYVPERKIGQTIFLDPDNRNISFTLGITDYRNPSKVSFDVLMEGFDTYWISNRSEREIRYTNLEAGYYTFRVRAKNAFGQISEEEDFVHLVVVKPWYNSLWFYAFLSLIVFGSLIGMILSRITYERRSNRLRNRIANDLHDEVSNTLNNIRIVALDAKRSNKESSQEDIKKIEEMSSYAIDHLQDVIWAIDLENRDIKFLLFRMQDNIDELLLERDIPVKLEKISLNESSTLDFLHRRNLLLIFKEALSNIVKHTKPLKVEITIGNIEGRFTLSVKNYFEERLDSKYKTGRGTSSMIQRAMALNGELETNDSGDAYEVVLRLKKML